MKRVRAFTLLEALVSTLIFVGVMAAGSGVFLAALRSQTGSEDWEIAQQSNLRAMAELEHLFGLAVSVQWQDRVGTSGQWFNRVALEVPHHRTGVLERWEFGYRAGDSGGFIEIVPPSGAAYCYCSDAVLGEGRLALFRRENFGGASYQWYGTGALGVPVLWKGELCVYR